MSNPESFVVEEINRLETEWDAQDEWIEQSFKRGRVTGEYYGQTGKERRAMCVDQVGRGGEGGGYSVSNGVATVCLGSMMINISGVIHDGPDLLTATLECNGGAGSIPPLIDRMMPPGFADVGYIATPDVVDMDDGLTITAYTWFPGDAS